MTFFNEYHHTLIERMYFRIWNFQEKTLFSESVEYLVADYNFVPFFIYMEKRSQIKTMISHVLTNIRKHRMSRNFFLCA